MHPELLYRIALTLIPNIGPVLARTLMSYCGSAKAVFEKSKKDLLKIPQIGEKHAAIITNNNALEKAAKELQFIEKNKIQALFYLDEAYPVRLKHFDQSPILLYYKGNANLNHERTVGIIGTRKATQVGKAICEELVAGLKPYNPLIISGLAYGIDITAHRHALKMGLQTIGIMGTGLDLIYPSGHQKTAGQMTEQGGVLTQFHSGLKPDARQFPMRNRVIAAMCDAIIVVETAKSGGSIITANMANDFNKDVFAVPGRLRDKNSVGCNWLIKTHKAALIESAEDIGYIMRWDANAQNKEGKQKKLFVELTDAERKVFDLLEEQESIHIDKIAFTTQIPLSKLAGVLFNLELQGLIKPMPGKHYRAV